MLWRIFEPPFGSHPLWSYMPRVLVVEDTTSLREVLCSVLSLEGFDVASSTSAEEALEQIQDQDFSLVLCDLKLPNKSGLDLLRDVRGQSRNVPFVVMTAYGNIEIAVEAMKFGAADFITKPFDPQMLCSTLRQLLERLSAGHAAPSRPSSIDRAFLTQSPAMEAVLRQARKVAPLSSTVTILGESGTGKELLARFIHNESNRRGMPFVAVNCGSVPADLLESEFFGHEAGAFTGATERRQGLFEMADGGSIFLDEIGIMPAALQVKLLRTLQESEVRRVGASKSIRVDTRVIAATNCDLAEEIRHSRFREDLYYRLSVVVIRIPALRERIEDISLLVRYYAKLYAQEFKKLDPQTGTISISPEAIRLLERYPWPGNVRELENVVQRAVIFSSDGVLTPESFQLEVFASPQEAASGTLPEISAAATRKAEIAALRKTLELTHGNKLRAAKLLGVSYKTLLNKIKEYELENPASLVQ